MHPESTTEPTAASQPPPVPDAHLCDCPMPLAVERAERHGAFRRVCTRCGLLVPIRWSRW